VAGIGGCGRIGRRNRGFTLQAALDMGINILANHAHVFPAAVNSAGTIDRLLRLLDACAIHEAVCFAPFAHQVRGQSIEPNEWLAGELEKQSRLHGFGTIDLEGGEIDDQVRRVQDLGLLGIKLHPNAQQFDILGDVAFKVYRAAERLGLFLTFHSGVHHYRIKHYNLLGFDEVAEHFPGLRFSLEHLGGYHFFPEALAVIVNRIPFPPSPGKRCMVYGGLTSVFTPHYNRFWYLPKDRLAEALLQAGPQQFIFGLDFPYNLEDNTKMGLQTLHELGLSEAQLAMVLGGNLREALGLPAPAPLPKQPTVTPVAPD
jgi:predicted TIM-barrel fold metal-dependent hydrolase